MNESLSKCRNCACLHYYEDGLSEYPTRCYCPQLDPGMLRCTDYVPTDNLEYLEWKLAKKM